MYVLILSVSKDGNLSTVRPPPSVRYLSFGVSDNLPLFLILFLFLIPPIPL